MVIRTFISFIRYLLQLPITITMVACRRWISFVILLYYIYRAIQQLMMHFIQNLSLGFHSFLDLYLNGSGSSVDNNWWYGISTSYWVENQQLSFCLFSTSYWVENLELSICLLKTHINLNGIYTKTLWSNGIKMLG